MASFPYYLGLLTHAGGIKLRIPNLVVRKLYLDRMLELCLPAAEDLSEVRATVLEFFRHGDVGPVLRLVEDKLLPVLSNRDYRHANEMVVKSLLLSLLFEDQIYTPVSELELRRGYSDLCLLVRPHRRGDGFLDFLFELKYVPRQELGKAGRELRRLDDDALAELGPVRDAFAAARSQAREYRRSLLRQRDDLDLCAVTRSSRWVWSASWGRRSSRTRSERPAYVAISSRTSSRKLAIALPGAGCYAPPGSLSKHTRNRPGWFLGSTLTTRGRPAGAGEKNMGADREATDFSAVLRHELARIERRRQNLPPPAAGEEDEESGGSAPDPIPEALNRRLVGLAFSGGGIRSATFNLGVVQALADLGLLNRFDYLSTVSGGGYLGGWLTALYHREGGETDRPHDVGERVAGRLRTRGRAAEAEGPEDSAIRFLRQYSNYLTPKAGFFSADTWTVLTTYLRNFLLNLTILVAFLGIVLLAARGVHVLGRSGVSHWLFLGIALAMALVAVLVLGFNMASFAPAARASRESGDEAPRWRRLLGQGAVQAGVVLPFFVAAIVGSAWLHVLQESFAVWRWAAGTALAYLLIWLLARLAVALGVRHGQQGVGWGNLIFWSPVAGGVGGLALWQLQALFSVSSISFWPVLVWGPPLLLVWFVLVAILHTGLMGLGIGDAQREWLSRGGAWMLIYGFGWTALTAATIYGPVLLLEAGAGLKVALASGWIGSTLGGLLATRGGGNGKQAGRLRRWIATLAPYVFIAGLLCLVALGLDWALSRGSLQGEEGWRELTGAATAGAPEVSESVTEMRTIDDGQRVTERRVTERSVSGGAAGGLAAAIAVHEELLADTTWKPAYWLLLGVLAAVLVLQAWRVDVNEFSMHGLYRNRLVRGYLGASVPPAQRRRRHQPFTGFHAGDDVHLRALDHHPGPYHLVNAALNLVGGGQLAWQERKAASFTFSSGYCGFDAGALARASGEGADAASAFRGTGVYASQPPPGSGASRPLSLGTAVAISGAAVSPHMGFRSSPAIAFLLTVFNVRLGWWLGNPQHPTSWAYAGPRFAFLNLLSELFGQTKERSRYVYLSDGGHFENLGIYELVRRRCRFIVAADAGADPDLAFDDLGNAIRKCRADFGIDVEIDVEPIRHQAEEGGRSRWHCVVGRIRYDRVHPDAAVGVLLYLKASLTGDEPADVLNYATENPTFPHQTTGDQWFDESQFESYRRLGHHVGYEALEKSVDAARRVAAGGPLEVEQVFMSLRQNWFPPSRPRHAAAFTRHSRTLKELFAQLRTEEHLAFLNPQFYIEWDTITTGKPRDAAALWLPPSSEEKKEGFYFCNSLIQLMEDVYLDLDLEGQYDHPDNRGWMNLFRHWTWSGMFRVTWAASASTYGARFQTFCWQRLGLETGRVEAELVLGDGGGRLRAADFDAAVADDEALQRLNFFERDLARAVLEGLEGDRVFVLQVEVKAPPFLAGTGADPLHLCFGVAVSHGGELRFIRVRDHLRRMGLGRRALRRLVERHGIVRHGSWEALLAALPEGLRGDFSDDARRRFLDLFESVRPLTAAGR